MSAPQKQHGQKHYGIAPYSMNGWFGGWLGVSVGVYVALIVLLIVADFWYMLAHVGDAEVSSLWKNGDLTQSVKLTFLTCTASAILSLFFAVPIGYVLSRCRFRGRAVIDAILDIPVVLPPLVIGLSLLILFNNFPPRVLELAFPTVEELFNLVGVRITNTKLAIVVAQFTVAAAFAVRTMKVTFDQIDERTEKVAMTLGASRGRAFFDVVLPQAGKGVIASGILAWARALGEFGPILVFAGATRGKTEV